MSESVENDATDWHDASDHPTLDSLLACPIRHREFRVIPLATTEGGAA